jgi:hypothetical protein
VAAISVRRNGDNSDAGGPRECVGCGRAYPQTAGHGPRNNGSLNAFSTSCSFCRARSLPGAAPGWLRGETHPRPPHGSMSWTGGRGSLTTSSGTMARARHGTRDRKLSPGILVGDGQLAHPGLEQILELTTAFRSATGGSRPTISSLSTRPKTAVAVQCRSSARGQGPGFDGFAPAASVSTSRSPRQRADILVTN